MITLPQSVFAKTLSEFFDFPKKTILSQKIIILTNNNYAYRKWTPLKIVMDMSLLY